MLVQYQNNNIQSANKSWAFWDMKRKHIPYSISSIILCCNFAAMDFNNIFWIHIVQPVLPESVEKNIENNLVYLSL